MSRLRPISRRQRRTVLLAAFVLIIAIGAVSTYRLRQHNSVLVTPSTYSECMGANIKVHIKWNMRGTASGQTVYVSSYRVGMLPLGFGSGPLAGEIDTGEWVNDGTTLLFSDDQHHVLAKRTIESTDCPSSPIWAESP